MIRPSSTQIVHQNSAITPLGSIKLAGFITNSRGVGQGQGRRLGKYALVYSLFGECHYWDERIGNKLVQPGEVFFLLPDVMHRYGAGPDGRWDEFFMVFEGALFDLWRAQGILDSKHSFITLHPVSYWLRRFQSCLNTHGLIGKYASLQQICTLQQVLVEVFAHDSGRNQVMGVPKWIQKACATLAEESERNVKLPDLAKSLGVSFETFRKKFTQVMGVSPSSYRTARIIDEACRLMLDDELSGKVIAQRLGFSDEYHFSRRFKQVTGQTPTDFRLQIRKK